MSNETRWTKGPWTVERNVIRGDADHLGRTVAVASTLNVAWPFGRRAVKEEPYNAHLIAAAPLMHLSLANRSLLCDDDFEVIVAAIEEGDSEKLRDMWERVQAKARKV